MPGTQGVDETIIDFPRYEQPPELVIAMEGNAQKLIDHLRQRQAPEDISISPLLGWIGPSRIDHAQLENLIDIATSNIARLAKLGHGYAGYAKLLGDASGMISFKAREESARLPSIPE